MTSKVRPPHTGPAATQSAGATTPAGPRRANARYERYAPAMAFARELDQAQGWSDQWAQRWVGQARQQRSVIQLMRPSTQASQRHWGRYRAQFLEPRRVQAGVDFWRAHETDLARAEATFGVPAWLVVGIIGVETLYGQHTGTHRVLDALSTLAFDFPNEHPRTQERTAFFRHELEAFLKMTRDTKTPPDQWLGSFAGAMGLPQFMPSNWGLYGVDFDGDGQVDLLRSPSDAIGSVARYLQAFGWRRGIPTHFAVSFDADSLQLETLLAPDILPTFSPHTMEAKGVHLPDDAHQHPSLLALVELENGTQPSSYVAGTDNFFVVTRYNRSSYYAMAVIELGQAVQALWRQP